MSETDATELARRWLAQNDAERSRIVGIARGGEAYDFRDGCETYPSLDECRTLARALLAMSVERDELRRACDRCKSTDRELDATFHCSTCWANLTAERDKLRADLDERIAAAVKGLDLLLRTTNAMREQDTTIATLTAERDELRRERDEIRQREGLEVKEWQDALAQRDRLRAGLVEACEIAARVVADSQVLPSTDSARIAALRALAEDG